MNKLVSVLILTALLGAVYTSNPGLVAVVKQPIIEKLKNQYFTDAFQTFGHQTIPDMKEGDLSLSNIVVDMKNDSPDNLAVSFVSAQNAIGVDVKNTNIEVQLHWHYKKSIVSLSGEAKVTGPINELGLNLAMGKKEDGEFTIPQISVPTFNLNMDKHAFHLDFKCGGCPGFVEDLISSVLKDTLIDKVKDAIQSQVPSQVDSIGNQVLQDSYPRTMNLYQDIDVATSLTDQITVADDHLEVPLDATVFPHAQGYKRPSDAEDMPHYNPNDPGEIMMFMSSYLANTLSDTLNTDVHSYEITVLGMNYKVSLDPAVGKSAIAFEEGDFSVTVNPTILATAFGVGLEFGATATLDPKISNGDATNMFSVTPTIKALEMNSLKIIASGQKIDISAVKDYLNAVIKGALNVAVIPTIPVAKQDILKLHVTNSELDFHKGYTEFGVLFDFGRQ